jgi:hypothetical protein
MASEIHVGDVGTQLIATVKNGTSVVDISSASSLVIILKKPDGESYEKTALLYSDGTDGKMHYVSVFGDFNAAGKYKIQGRVSIDGATYSSSVESFTVYCNL